MCRKHAAAASHGEATRAAHTEASASLAAHVKRRARVAAALAALPCTLQPQAPCNQGVGTFQTQSLHASQSEAPAELPAPKRSATRGASTAAEQDPGCCPGLHLGFETVALERAAAAAPRRSAMRLAATIGDSSPSSGGGGSGCGYDSMPASTAGACQKGISARAVQGLSSDEEPSPQPSPGSKHTVDACVRLGIGARSMQELSSDEEPNRKRKPGSSSECAVMDSSPPAGPPATRTAKQQTVWTLRSRARGAATLVNPKSRRSHPVSDPAEGGKPVTDSAEDKAGAACGRRGEHHRNPSTCRQAARRASRVRGAGSAGGKTAGGSLEQEVLALAAEEDHLLVRQHVLPAL